MIQLCLIVGTNLLFIISLRHVLSLIFHHDHVVYVCLESLADQWTQVGSFGEVLMAVPWTSRDPWTEEASRAVLGHTADVAGVHALLHGQRLSERDVFGRVLLSARRRATPCTRGRRECSSYVLVTETIHSALVSL